MTAPTFHRRSPSSRPPRSVPAPPRATNPIRDASVMADGPPPSALPERSRPATPPDLVGRRPAPSEARNEPKPPRSVTKRTARIDGIRSPSTVCKINHQRTKRRPRGRTESGRTPTGTPVRNEPDPRHLPHPSVLHGFLSTAPNPARNEPRPVRTVTKRTAAINIIPCHEKTCRLGPRRTGRRTRGRTGRPARVLPEYARPPYTTKPIRRARRRNERPLKTKSSFLTRVYGNSPRRTRGAPGGAPGADHRRSPALAIGVRGRAVDGARGRSRRPPAVRSAAARLESGRPSQAPPSIVPHRPSPPP